MAAWLSGSALVSTNEVTVRRVAGPVSTGMGDRLRAGKRRFVTSHSGQLNLLPSAGREMSTGRRAVTLCGWGVKADMVHSTCG